MAFFILFTNLRGVAADRQSIGTYILASSLYEDVAFGKADTRRTTSGTDLCGRRLTPQQRLPPLSY